MSKLAIVIPAYKSIYFDQVLLSIANQTNKDFTLYIGDDCSPENLYNIVEKYYDAISIVYVHFDENLGGKDLVAQWERCIDLVGNEEWIWLFSDDDMMDRSCVERFYDTILQYPNFDLFHYNVLQIDEYQNIIGTYSPYPEVLTSEKFLKYRLQGILDSYVVEYVFRKSHFYDQGRFQNFDLAWGSDDALWIKLGKERGIRTIEKANVYWRRSPFNISTNFWDNGILIRKYYAQIEFANWVYIKAKKNEIQFPIIKLTQLIKKWLFKSIEGRIEFISFKMIAVLISKFYLILDEQIYPKQRIAFFYFYKVFRFIKGILKKVLFWNYCKYNLLVKIRKSRIVTLNLNNQL